jgi:hypothetical protein
MEEKQVKELRLGDSAIQVNFREINFENMNWKKQGMQIVKIGFFCGENNHPSS